MSVRIVKTFVASGALAHRQLVKATATDGEVIAASSAADDIIGVVDYPSGAADGERVDVVLFGEAEVQAGGTIAPFGYFTSDASGHAVAAAPATGVNNGVGGRVRYGAADGDFVHAFINPARIQGE